MEKTEAGFILHKLTTLQQRGFQCHGDLLYNCYRVGNRSGR